MRWTKHNGMGALRVTNTETGQVLDDDPRLPPLPDHMEVAETAMTPVPSLPSAFLNKTTGEVVRNDPRLTPEALQARGVEVETFTLV
jgi:acetyl esterase/lipase